MVESVGKKLSQARLKRNLTIEEAAHVTKLRPDKIIALENDDYSTFPSNTYAKGFLQIYGRYLGVDVTEFMQSLESSNAISIEDYQYLSNAPAPKRSEPIKRERRPPSLAPLMFFIFVVVAGLATMWVVEINKRTQPSGRREQFLPEKEDTGSQASGLQSPPPVAQTPPSPTSSDAPPASRPAATPASAHRPASSPAPAPAAPAIAAPAAPTAKLAGNSTPAPTASPEPRLSPSVLSDRDFVTPTIVPTPDPAAITSPRSGLNEILIASVKKTWVTIRKDDPKAAPIFEDYLYPNANPLKLKGARFFIDAREPGSVQITKNGLPFAYQAPNVPVQ